MKFSVFVLLCYVRR